jgi:NAD(P)-dependent dehydrogenase (short-subunit alcohol dehydrogenase family)
MGNLDGQVALVVGAAGGIGRAVVQRYVAEGASVLAVDRDASRLAELGAGDRVDVFAADVSDWASAERAVAAAVDRFGGLDVLVSCVGIYDQAVRLVDIPGDRLAAAFDECFRVNVGSALLLVRAAIRPLAERRGRIVLTGSFAGHRTAGGGVLYTASKHALVGVVSQLAYELAPKIRVNAVAPGVAATVMSGLGSLDQARQPALLPGTEDALPLGVLPDVADYGALYALLGSATDSAATTGSVMLADSGLLVRGVASVNAGQDL